MRLLAGPLGLRGLSVACLRRFGSKTASSRRSLFIAQPKVEARPSAIASATVKREEIRSFNFHEQLQNVAPKPPVEDAFIRFRKAAHELSDKSTKKTRRKAVQQQLNDMRTSIQEGGDGLWEAFDFPFIKPASGVWDPIRKAVQDEGELAVLQKLAGDSLGWFCRAVSSVSDQNEMEVLGVQLAKALRHRKAFLESMGTRITIDLPLKTVQWQMTRNDLLVLAVSPHSLAKGDFTDGYLVSQETLDDRPVTVVKQRRMPEGSKVTIMSLHQLVSQPVPAEVAMAGGSPQKPWERTLKSDRPLVVELGTVLAEIDFLKFRKTQDFLPKLRRGLGEFEQRTRLVDVEGWLGMRARLTGKPPAEVS